MHNESCPIVAAQYPFVVRLRSFRFSWLSSPNIPDMSVLCSYIVTSSTFRILRPLCLKGLRPVRLGGFDKPTIGTSRPSELRGTYTH